VTRVRARLHAASSRFLVGHGVGRGLHYLCKPSACTGFQSRRGLRHRFVGAYGVVGFSGVKDARKSVLIADALASADQSARKFSPTGQTLDKYWTKTGQMGANGTGSVHLVCNRCALGVHQDYRKATSRLQEDYTSDTGRLPSRHG
jgi:hypothetical protein